MKIYIVMFGRPDEDARIKHLGKSFESKEDADDYCQGKKFHWVYECEFEPARRYVIAGPSTLTGIRPEDMVGGKIFSIPKWGWYGVMPEPKDKRPENFEYDFGAQQKCLFEGLPSHDNRGRMIAYGLSCNCPKCSPQC